MIKNRFSFMTEKANPTRLKLTLVYLLGFIALLTGWWVGVLGPLFVASGWVGKLVFGLVGVHIGLAFYALSRPGYFNLGLFKWLEHLSGAILMAGFLGKLYGISATLNAVVATNATNGGTLISQGVAIALYSTILGMALSFWTNCANIVISNYNK
jgi:hypothetical protein